MDDHALDRLIATVESLQALYEVAKHDGDPTALVQLLKQCEAALEQIERLRSR